MLLNEEKGPVPVEVDVLSPDTLDPVSKGIFAPVRNVLAILLHPLVFNHIPTIMVVLQKCAKVVECQEAGKVGRQVRSLLVPLYEPAKWRWLRKVLQPVGRQPTIGPVSPSQIAELCLGGNLLARMVPILGNVCHAHLYITAGARFEQ